MQADNPNILPGLAREEVHTFWEQTNPELLTLLREMEQRETWVIKDSEADQVVKGLESVIPAFCRQHFVDGLEDSDKAALLATLVGYMGASQFVAFLLKVEAVRDGVLKNITYALRNDNSAESKVFVDLFLERIQLVLRSDLRRSVFSGRRIKEIGAIIRSVNNWRASHA